MLPQLSSFPQPSQLLDCSNLINCFQTIYNLGFAIFLALAFFNFLFGAFQYLLSPTRIFDQEKGKSKMKDSIISLIIVLVLPVVLYFIDSQIFEIKLEIPVISIVTTTSP